MTFTFASTSTTVTDLYWIRLRIADTSSASAKLTDEEINNILATVPNRYLAAAVAADTIGASLVLKTDKTVGKFSISQSQGSKAYFDLGKTLRREASLFASPYAGGISADDKASEVADSDRVAPAFTMGQFNDVGASDASTAIF